MVLSDTYKRNGFGQVILTLLVTAIMWVPAFINPVPPMTVSRFAPLYDLLYGVIYTLPRLASAIALVLVLAEAIWLNVILDNFKMIRTGSLMPMLIYIIAMSWNSTYLTINPMLLSNAMVIAACRQLLSSGGVSLPVTRVFNATFCIGMAAMCYMPNLFLIVPFIFVAVLYKMYRWNDIAASLLGLTAPCIILIVYAFMADKLDYYIVLVAADFRDFNARIDDVSTLNLVRDIIILLLLFAALATQLTSMNDNMVHQRINSGVLTLPLIAAILLMFDSVLIPVDMMAISIPLSFLATRFLYIERKRAWINEAIMWILILCAITNNI